MIQTDFSDSFVKIFAVSRIEAIKLGHDRIGTEHFLLAILACATEDEAIKRLGMDASSLRQRIVGSIVRGTLAPGAENLKFCFTSEAIKSLERAGLEASKACSERIGPDHLLLGIVQEGDSLSLSVLAEAGITSEKILERKETP